MVEFPFYMPVALGAFLARLLVGSVLLVAGVAKLKLPSNRFLQAVLGYDLAPKLVAIVLARALPWVEVMLGGLLLVGLWNRLISLISGGLLLIFSGGIAFSLLRGKRNECGCFQSLTLVRWQLVYRNLFLITLLLPVYLLNGGVLALENSLGLQNRWHFQPSLSLVILGIGCLMVLITSVFRRWSAVLPTVE